MGSSVMVLEPLTTHSMLLLFAQGDELEVQSCEWFPLVGTDGGAPVAAPSICEIGLRLGMPEGVSTHSQVSLSAKGVEPPVHDCEWFELGVEDANSTGTACIPHELLVIELALNSVQV
jgi:hypothetical protein